MSGDGLASSQDRRVLIAVLAKVSFYYAALFSLVFALLTVFPNLITMLPVGGVDQLSSGAELEIMQLEDAMLSGDFDEEVEDAYTAIESPPSLLFDDARNLFFSMLGALLLMFPVSWVYRAIHRRGEHDHSLDETTLILPGVVAGIVIVVQHSLALAFSLAGIVAGVQFRRALSDTFDTLFIFVSIAVGIAAGIKALDIAAVITVFFTVSSLMVCIFGDGLESQHLADRKQAKSLAKANRDKGPLS